MKKFFFIPGIVFLFACHNNDTGNTPSPAVADDSVAKPAFFPVTSFLKGQLFLFDSLLITPLHITYTKAKTDSAWIKTAALKAGLQPFLTPEINDSNLVHFFKETKFNDLDVKAITFTYQPLSTLPDSINLSMWNVYVNQQSAQVTKIYMLKHFKSNDSNITQELTWQVNKYAEIVDILNKPDTAEVIKREKFIWNFDN